MIIIGRMSFSSSVFSIIFLYMYKFIETELNFCPQADVQPIIVKYFFEIYA